MEFKLPVYETPDFTQDYLAAAPDVTTAVVQADGIAPEQFHGTSMFPEYFKISGEWILAEESRMDCCVVVRPDNSLDVVELRNLKKATGC